MTDRLVSMPAVGSNYTAIRNPQDPNLFIVSNAFTGESYIVDPTSPEYASVNQDIRMAISLAMAGEIAQSQQGAPQAATTPAAGSSTPPAAGGGESRATQVGGHPSGFGSPQQLQSAMSKFGKDAWDWGFASYSPSGWGTGGWHPGYTPNVWSGAEGYALAQGPDYYRSWLGQQDPYSGYGWWQAGPQNASQFWGSGMTSARMPAQPAPQAAPAKDWGILGEDFWRKVNADPAVFFGR